MHRNQKRSRPDRLPLQTIHQDERISDHAGNHHQFLTRPLIAEAAVGISITFLVFINSIASNIPRAFSRMFDESMPTSDFVLKDSTSTAENTTVKTTEADRRDLEMVDIASLSAPDALAIYFADEDMASRDGALRKSTMNASPADEQRRDARKVAMHEALCAIQDTSRHSSCISPNEPPMSRNIAVTFSNSGRATTARVANSRTHDAEKAGCMARTLRTVSVKPFDGAPTTVYRTMTVK